VIFHGILGRLKINLKILSRKHTVLRFNFGNPGQCQVDRLGLLRREYATCVKFHRYLRSSVGIKVCDCSGP